MKLAGLGFGLGAACSTGLLSPEQIYQVALSSGFPEQTAIQMTAIAMRESGGCPGAHYTGGGKEDSYGLWQINVRGNPRILTQLGISPEDLYDPAINAQAAFLLWGGNDANLDIAWYINRPGYKEAYLSYLPVAMAASGAGPGAPPDLTGIMEPSLVPEAVGGVSMLLVAILGVAGVLLLSRS